jgi:hypothetical protein
VSGGGAGTTADAAAMHQTCAWGRTIMAGDAAASNLPLVVEGSSCPPCRRHKRGRVGQALLWGGVQTAAAGAFCAPLPSGTAALQCRGGGGGGGGGGGAHTSSCCCGFGDAAAVLSAAVAPAAVLWRAAALHAVTAIWGRHSCGRGCCVRQAQQHCLVPSCSALVTGV